MTSVQLGKGKRPPRTPQKRANASLFEHSARSHAAIELKKA